MKNKLVKIGVIDCGNECDVVQPYGFVPEDGCKLHDNNDTVDRINILYGKHCLQDGDVFGGFSISYVP